MTAGEYLAESIDDPSAFISPTFAGSNGATAAMPNLSVTPGEVDTLVAYLLST